MQAVTPSIELILQEIERAISAKLYYLAIVLTLTLPDICAALESATGRVKEGNKEYKKWYQAHVKDKVGGLDADDCYSLRCGVVHQGRMHVMNKEYGRVIFTVNESNPRVDSLVYRIKDKPDVPGAFAFDAEMFCKRFIAATRAWFEQAKNNPVVVANLPNLVHFRPYGIPPYYVGQPAIG